MNEPINNKRTYDYSTLPPGVQGCVQRYLEEHVQPGHFMTAVLCNDLRVAFRRADDINREALFDIVSWLYVNAPAISWGSPEAVSVWLGERGTNETH